MLSGGLACRACSSEAKRSAAVCVPLNAPQLMTSAHVGSKGAKHACYTLPAKNTNQRIWGPGFRIWGLRLGLRAGGSTSLGAVLDLGEKEAGGMSEKELAGSAGCVLLVR